jgi:hypothetical protein
VCVDIEMKAGSHVVRTESVGREREEARYSWGKGREFG